MSSFNSFEVNYPFICAVDCDSKKKKSARLLYSSKQTIVSLMLTEVESDEVTHVAKQSHLKGKHWVPKSPTIRYSNSLRLGTLSDVQWTPNSKKEEYKIPLFFKANNCLFYVDRRGKWQRNPMVKWLHFRRPILNFFEVSYPLRCAVDPPIQKRRVQDSSILQGKQLSLLCRQKGKVTK